MILCEHCLPSWEPWAKDFDSGGRKDRKNVGVPFLNLLSASLSPLVSEEPEKSSVGVL